MSADNQPMQEYILQAQVLKFLGSQPHIRMFRNQVGVGWVGNADRHPDGTVVIPNARRVSMGLHVGSGDLIGWKTLTVTPDMVGKQVAVFTSVEIKTPAGRVSPDQKNWLERVNSAGGLARVVRDLDQARKLTT